MISTILIVLTILFILANLYSFFTNGSYKKSSFNSSLFLQLFINLVGIGFGFAFLYYLLSLNNVILRVSSPTGEPVEPTFSNLLYFSGVTLLSIGYGDYVPVGGVRFFAIMESAIGVLLPSAYFMKALGSSNHEKEEEN